MGLFFVTRRTYDGIVAEWKLTKNLLTQEQIKNGKLRKAIHDARDVMEKVAPVEEGK